MSMGGLAGYSPPERLHHRIVSSFSQSTKWRALSQAVLSGRTAMRNNVFRHAET
jgi:hypothetical protein